MQAYVREQFDKNKAIRKINIDRIERLLQKGRRQLRDFKHTDSGFVVKRQ